MRNRRTTKTTRRTLTVEEEDRLKEVPLLLQDLKGQVLSILSSCEDNTKLACKSIKTNHKTTLNKLDFATRSLFVESSVFAQSEKNEDVSAQCADIDEYLSDVKSTVKTTSRVRRVAGGSTVRKSSRKRVAETPLSSGSAVSMVTPSNKMLPTNIGRTPMITPKFDTRTPLTRTLHRQAKPNETLVSLSGSPVMATATVKKVGRGKAKQSEADSFAQIPLGKNYTLSMPISADFQTDGLELDDDQINKLALIQQGLTNMLRGRIASSESE
ncbi:borealin isoform X2 [Eurytemora carolleeae]|uniref:borealin isoform X2 n=1 Tax=Eurytemora carolleeae TaxID=1294199 RepID=UPI000C77869A|nr:borealin isoform X2 [Eurytemora carolleeae]|eukprot:XP_023324066.1 borealin-like isoform X2 [Eurytemora affinis]